MRLHIVNLKFHQIKIHQTQKFADPPKFNCHQIYPLYGKDFYDYIL